MEISISIMNQLNTVLVNKIIIILKLILMEMRLEKIKLCLTLM